MWPCELFLCISCFVSCFFVLCVFFRVEEAIINRREGNHIVVSD